ncbi:MAG: hypothetical protein ACO1N5_11060 [Noviherbaspirillum sp.]
MQGHRGLRRIAQQAGHMHDAGRAGIWFTHCLYSAVRRQENPSASAYKQHQASSIRVTEDFPLKMQMITIIIIIALFLK